MSKHNIVFIGMDTHKSFIEVAYIEDVRGVKPIHLGKNPSTKQSVTKLVRRFESKCNCHGHSAGNDCLYLGDIA